MTQKTAMNFRVDPEQLAAMQRVREAIGVPVSEQIRRGIRLWLEAHGELAPAGSTKKAARARAATRTRA